MTRSIRSVLGEFSTLPLQVIQHNSESSPYARTVVIQNTPQAFKAFGVKNIPRHILDGWARYKREHVVKVVETEQEDAHNDTDDYIDAVFSDN